MTSTTEPTGRPLRILVADDEAAIRDIMTSILTGAGYECRVAKTPSEALEILQSRENVIETYPIRPVDLVICGIKAWAEEDLKRMIRRTISGGDSVPVVVSIALHDMGLMMKVLRMGAYDFLLKPFEREQLIFAVHRAFEHRRLKLENLFLKDRL